MSCYVDTSVLIALYINEQHSDAVSHWYINSRDKLISSMWCVTEFASALGIKQRTGQLNADEALLAWQRFQNLCQNDLSLLTPNTNNFQKAAELTLNTSSGLRAGDALHLAAALQAQPKRIATLDEVFARNAKLLKIPLIKF